MTDVARQAGCSQTTVSFVLSGKPGASISPATSRRVLEAAATLGYRHPAPARQLAEASADPAAATAATGKAPAREAARRRGHSRTAHLTHEIGLRIIAGLYVEEAVLPGDGELMREFGVSRTVLREAKKTLSGKGLLEAKSRIGTRVRNRAEWQIFDVDVLGWHAEAGLESKFLGALGEMRLLIEPEAAALAATRRRSDQLPQLHAWVDQMAAAGKSRRDFVDADLGLHLHVVRLAGNPFLSALGTLIEVALVAAMTRSSPVDRRNGATASAAAHRKIVEAIARGDSDGARMAMRRVVQEGIRHASATRR
jgi:DNA-binding FadR family transcriptional regulator